MFNFGKLVDEKKYYNFQIKRYQIVWQIQLGKKLYPNGFFIVLYQFISIKLYLVGNILTILYVSMSEQNNLMFAEPMCYPHYTKVGYHQCILFSCCMKQLIT